MPLIFVAAHRRCYDISDNTVQLLFFVSQQQLGRVLSGIS